jgi:hypothetical protein
MTEARPTVAKLGSKRPVGTLSPVDRDPESRFVTDRAPETSSGPHSRPAVAVAS